MEPLIFLTLAVAGVGILVVFLLFDLKSKVNKLQVYVEDLEKINQENLNKQEEKFRELQTLLSQLAKNNLENLIKYLGEYASLTSQQLKTTQKEFEEELQTLLSQLAKNNLENLTKYLGEYASLTSQQLKTTQKEFEELKDRMNEIFKTLAKEITDKANKLQVCIEESEKINQAHLSKQEEKFNEYLREYTNLTIQQLKATQKELEELKDSINKMYKLLTEEITDKDL